MAEMLRLTNEARIAAGLPAFQTDSKLNQAAAIRAQELTVLYSHGRPCGRSCFTVLAECQVSYHTAGENIARASANFYEPSAIVSSWLNSEGHRANIMNPNFTSIGIGYARAFIYKDGSWQEFEHFVQLFIG
jgi:uncharacterized protein YkwD